MLDLTVNSFLEGKFVLDLIHSYEKKLSFLTNPIRFS